MNVTLSQQRAESAKAELVKLGVDTKRLAAEGYGSQYPVAPNADAAGRAQNRRIDVRVTNK
jgi:OmpA-OmpF porin, OOP family